MTGRATAIIDAERPSNGLRAVMAGRLIVRRRIMQHGGGPGDPDSVSALLEPLAGASMVRPRKCSRLIFLR